MIGKLIPQIRAMARRPRSVDAGAVGGVAGANPRPLKSVPLNSLDTRRTFYYPPFLVLYTWNLWNHPRSST